MKDKKNIDLKLTDIQKRNRINYIKENKDRVNIKNGKKIQDKFLNNKEDNNFVEFDEQIKGKVIKGCGFDIFEYNENINSFIINEEVQQEIIDIINKNADKFLK